VKHILVHGKRFIFVNEKIQILFFARRYFGCIWYNVKGRSVSYKSGGLKFKRAAKNTLVSAQTSIRRWLIFHRGAVLFLPPPGAFNISFIKTIWRVQTFIAERGGILAARVEHISNS
jgi:hypothetical protein